MRKDTIVGMASRAMVFAGIPLTMRARSSALEMPGRGREADRYAFRLPLSALIALLLVAALLPPFMRTRSVGT